MQEPKKHKTPRRKHREEFLVLVLKSNTNNKIKNKQVGLHQIKKLLQSGRNNQQNTDWEKIFAN